MVFSGIPFLFVFLPAVLALYYAVPKKGKTVVLLLSSVAFYFYGEQRLVLLMLFTALWDYACALLIEKTRNRRVLPKIGLLASILVDVCILCYFKYTDFFLSSFNSVLGTDLKILGIVLPIGISFYTFQSMSYTVDVYRGDVKAEKNPIAYAAYLTMFPQLVAGPIVRYEDVRESLGNPAISAENLADGAMRFTVGLSKKVLLANALGAYCSGYAEMKEKTVVLAWLYVILYSLQLFFDFSGYSDMAIGLGKMLGFSFPENFDYPYCSRSVSEFWRRWHITLGSWFKKYVYIPLGGSQNGTGKWLLSLFTVWTLTGLWHGAGWNFVLWGLYFFVLLVIEKVFFKKMLSRIPAVFSHLYLLLAVGIGFVLFSSSENLGGLSGGFSLIASLFGAGNIPFSSSQTLYYLRDYAALTLICAVCATPVVKKSAKRMAAFCKGTEILKPVLILFLLLFCVANLANSTFNPFLYFNF